METPISTVMSAPVPPTSWVGSHMKLQFKTEEPEEPSTKESPMKVCPAVIPVSAPSSANPKGNVGLAFSWGIIWTSEDEPHVLTAVFVLAVGFGLVCKLGLVENERLDCAEVEEEFGSFEEDEEPVDEDDFVLFDWDEEPDQNDLVDLVFFMFFFFLLLFVLKQFPHRNWVLALTGVIAPWYVIGPQISTVVPSFAFA